MKDAVLRARVESDLIRRVESLAKSKGTTVASIVRESLLRYLKAQAKEEKPSEEPKPLTAEETISRLMEQAIKILDKASKLQAPIESPASTAKAPAKPSAKRTA